MKECTRGWIVLVLIAAAVGSALGEERVLPLGKSMAGEGKLPLPFGVGAQFYYQEQDYALDRLAFASEAGPIAPATVAALLPGVKINNELTEADLKLDAWLLPFLNVFGLVGYIDGATEVKIGGPFGTLDVDYEGLVYGGGATLAGALGNVFGSLTVVRTETDLDTSDSSVSSLVVMPRVGYACPQAGPLQALRVWVGGLYEEAEETHKGRVNVQGLGPIRYDVDLKQNKDWNYLVGAGLALTERIGLELEGGFGERTTASASLTYRF